MAAERIIRRDQTGWRVESLLADDPDARFPDREAAIAYCRELGGGFEIDDAAAGDDVAPIGGDGRDVMPDALRDLRGPR